MTTNFIPITDFNNYHAEQSFAIYLKSFPSNERQKEEVLKQRLVDGTEEMFVGLIKDEVNSICLVFNLRDSGYVLLDYFAVLENLRGSGIGTRFMQYLIQYYNNSNKELILEVEDPSEGINLEQREKRVDFYRKLGAKCLQDVHYILPALDGTTSTSMILMIFTRVYDSEMPRSVLVNLLVCMYEQVYNKNSDDPLVREVIRTLPNVIKLI